MEDNSFLCWRGDGSGRGPWLECTSFSVRSHRGGTAWLHDRTRVSRMDRRACYQPSTNGLTSTPTDSCERVALFGTIRFPFPLLSPGATDPLPGTTTAFRAHPAD